MNDKFTPIEGYFKVDLIKDGKVIDSYEDKNTIMARIPELVAGRSCGFYTARPEECIIGTIALGTAGERTDAFGNKVPKIVRNTREMLFSELAFWNTDVEDHIEFDRNKYVYQTTFIVPPKGDLGQNVSAATPLEIQNEGATYPHVDGVPTDYRLSPQPVDNGLTGTISLRQNVVEYNFTLGQYAGNADDDSVINYNEAGLYLGAQAQEDGNPLGLLFSMKAFPSQPKNSTCSLKITWKLFF